MLKFVRSCRSCTKLKRRKTTRCESLASPKARVLVWKDRIRTCKTSGSFLVLFLAFQSPLSISLAHCSNPSAQNKGINLGTHTIASIFYLDMLIMLNPAWSIVSSPAQFTKFGLFFVLQHDLMSKVY